MSQPPASPEPNQPLDPLQPLQPGESRGDTPSTPPPAAPPPPELGSPGAPPPYMAQPPPPYGAPPPPPGAAPYGATTPPPASPYGAAPYAGGGYGGNIAYGQVPAGMYYDPNSGLLLPENVTLASVGRRIGAWFLSLVLVIVTLGIGYVIWGLIIWNQGQTPALQVLGMRCWRPDDQRVAGFWWMALRDIIGRIAEGILSFISGLVSFILFLASKDHKALHDLIAGTVVVHDPHKVLAHRSYD